MSLSRSLIRSHISFVVNTCCAIFTSTYLFSALNCFKHYRTSADGVLGRPKAESVTRWAAGCALIPAITGTAMYFTYDAENGGDDVGSTVVLVLGIVAFAGAFAVNSAIHSYLIVSFSDKVS